MQTTHAMCTNAIALQISKKTVKNYTYNNPYILY